MKENGITIDWNLTESVWVSAARAFRFYAERRRKQSDQGPRRLLADFVIGAHADSLRCRLLSLDERLYRAAFPALKVEGA